MHAFDYKSLEKADIIITVTKEIDQGAGVLYIYGNYGGDILNFDMAAEMADFEADIRVESVVAGDDVASGERLSEGKKKSGPGLGGPRVARITWS